MGGCFSYMMSTGWVILPRVVLLAPFSSVNMYFSYCTTFKRHSDFVASFMGMNDECSHGTDQAVMSER